jgi:hypothetical protein
MPDPPPNDLKRVFVLSIVRNQFEACLRKYQSTHKSNVSNPFALGCQFGTSLSEDMTGGASPGIQAHRQAQQTDCSIVSQVQPVFVVLAKLSLLSLNIQS